MNLKPPSILLPVAGAAIGFAVAGRNYWAIGAGALAGALGNALLNLAAVKNEAALQLGADVGMGPKVPGASMGKEFFASLTGDSKHPVYSAAMLQAGQFSQSAPTLPQAPAPTGKAGEVQNGTSSDPSAVTNWLQQIANAGTSQQGAPREQTATPPAGTATMGPVVVASVAKPARKVPAAARFRAAGR